MEDNAQKTVDTTNFHQFVPGTMDEVNDKTHLCLPSKMRGCHCLKKQRKITKRRPE
jgi:hypothetical protein